MEGESRLTSGKWKRGNPSEFAVPIYSDTGKLIASVFHGPSSDVTSDVNEAIGNAQAISAVPEMLEALEAAIETIRAWHGEDMWDVYYHNSPEMKKISHALSNAKSLTPHPKTENR